MLPEQEQPISINRNEQSIEKSEPSSFNHRSLPFFEAIKRHKLGVGLAVGVLATTAFGQADRLLGNTAQAAEPTKTEQGPTNNHIATLLNNVRPRELAGELIIGASSVIPGIALVRGLRTFGSGGGGIKQRWERTTEQFMGDDNFPSTMLMGMTSFSAISTLMFGQSRFDTGLYYPIGTIFAALLPVWREVDLSEKKYAGILKMLAPEIFGAYLGTALAADLFPQVIEHPFITHLEYPPHVLGLAFSGYKTIRAFNEMSHGSRTHLRDILFYLSELEPAVKVLFFEFEINNLPKPVASLIDKIGKNVVDFSVTGDGGLIDEVFVELEKRRISVSKDEVKELNNKRDARNKEIIAELSAKGKKQGKEPLPLEKLLPEDYQIPFDIPIEKLKQAVLRALEDRKIRLEEMVGIQTQHPIRTEQIRRRKRKVIHKK